MSKESEDYDRAIHKGFRLGMDAAILMARGGRLRIGRAPWETDEYPRAHRIRPWRITRLAWRSWWREKPKRLRDAGGVALGTVIVFGGSVGLHFLGL